jgi:hypothetical protein
MDLLAAFKILACEDDTYGPAEEAEASRVLEVAIRGVCRGTVAAQSGSIDVDDLASMLWTKRLWRPGEDGRPRKGIRYLFERNTTSGGCRIGLHKLAAQVGQEENRRRNSRPQIVPLDTPGDESMEPEEHPAFGDHGAAAQASDDVIVIHDLLDRLSDDELEFVELHIYRGLSKTEIAQLKGVSNATMTRLHVRVLDNLRRLATG